MSHLDEDQEELGRLALPSPEELLASLGKSHSAHEPEARPAPRILIIGYESAGRHLAKLMLEGMKRNDGLYYHGEPGIPVGKPQQTTGCFEISLRDLCEPRMFDCCDHDHVLRTDARNLRAILRPALMHSQGRERNKGPKKRGKDSRWS